MELCAADLEAFEDDSKLAGLAESTIKSYVDCLRRYMGWCDQRGVQTTTMRSARGYLATLTKWRGYLTSRVIKRYGKWMAEECGSDPFVALQFVAQPAPTPQRTTVPANIASMLLTCDTTIRGVRDRALIMLLASTGMRRGEVVRMTWDDIVTATGTITIPQTKAGRPRTVRLSRMVSRYVAAVASEEAHEAHRRAFG